MFCLTNFSLYENDDICYYVHDDGDDLDYDILYEKFYVLDNISYFPFFDIEYYFEINFYKILK
jgi:hypothetical protein